jgi:FMNH2-dependent dimethyl sulfone monooxygenase
MRFGIWTPLPHVIRQEARMEAALANYRQSRSDTRRDAAFDFAVDIVRQAEAYGFASTLVAQRYLGPDLEAWTLASALAPLTETIELMVAVHPGMLTPQVIAKMAASLDRISGGRCAINIVNGHWVEEFNLFGNGSWLSETDARYRRMDEFIRVLRMLWSEQDVVFKGEFFDVDIPKSIENKAQKVVVPEAGQIQVKAWKDNQPPIYAASRSVPGRKTIAEHCDVWFAEYKPGYRNFEQNLQMISKDIGEMSELCAKVGRKVGFGLNPLVVCEDTMEKAIALAEAIEDPTNKDRISNSLGAGLVGTPEVIAERIRRLEEAGISDLMLRFTPMEEGLQLFGERVMKLLD